jgi:tetratricopeptide (TPR) repeat protein
MLNNLGMVYFGLGEKGRALEYHEKALPILRDVGDRARECTVLFNIARIRQDDGKLAEAIALLERVVEIRAAIHHPDLASDRAALEHLRITQFALTATPASPPPPLIITSPAPIDLFFSYSHVDDPLRNEFTTHLASLRREGLITEWHDRRIGAGEDWKAALDAHLAVADVVLLLVSPDFIASDYCYEIEATRALERDASGEAVVIPIILRPTDWTHTPIARLQSLPTNAEPITLWPNRDEAWLDVVRGLRAAIAKVARRPS